MNVLAVGSTDLRWKQRFERFSKALAQLDDACRLTNYTNLESAGLLRTFMLTFELGWKTLRDFLFYEGLYLESPRQVIRQGFVSDILYETDCEIFLNALEDQNLRQLMYDGQAALDAETSIKHEYQPMLSRLRSKLLCKFEQ